MNKKTTILGIIAIAFFGGIIWHFGPKVNTERQTASILDNKDNAGEEQVNLIEEEFFLGSPDAPVTMVEYSSHLCGHCSVFHDQTLPLLIDKYVKTGKIKIIPRLLSPVELGMTVLCAQEQGKFQEMNEYLFKNVKDIKSADDLKEKVVEAGLNKENFSTCFDSARYEENIAEWFGKAEEFNVSGTPTFFINDQEISGNQPISEFERVIEEELAKN
ncbi:DsbA family protein [Patescibacteria group bacterium]